MIDFELNISFFTGFLTSKVFTLIFLQLRLDINDFVDILNINRGAKHPFLKSARKSF